MHQLTIDGKPRILSKDVYTIGRSIDCDFCIPHPRVSRNHATLKKTPDGWRIQNHGENGTFVNDSPVESALLSDGDELRFNGSEAAIFELVSTPENEQTIFDAPTATGAIEAQIQRIEQRIEDGYLENKNFHEAQSRRLEEVSQQVERNSQADQDIITRVDALEHQAEALSGTDQRVFGRLDEIEERARKGISVLLAGLGAIAFLAFGSLVFKESERQEFRAALIDSVGGPTGVATILSGVLLGTGAIAAKPGRKNVGNVGLVGSDIRLGSDEPEASHNYRSGFIEPDREPSRFVQRGERDHSRQQSGEKGSGFDV